MRIVRIIFFALIAALPCSDLYAGPASSKLSALAGSLISDYQAKTGESKAVVAVFPFNCEEKLARQRVGFAAAELMSHRFVAANGFTVLERGEIGKLLGEQKLQSSGATDSATTVKLGKILGASVLVLGNINKVDGYYQVNARIVSVETGEVQASGYTELPVDAFADDAGVYLNLVPQEQTLGIYGVLNYRHNSNNIAPYTETGWEQVDFYPRSFKAYMAGGGLLYRPHRKIQVNAEIITGKSGNTKHITKVHTNGGSGTWVQEEAFELTAVSFMVSYVGRLAGKLNYLAGAGAQGIISVVSDAKEKTTPLPLVKVGVEYKPQSRVGLGLNAKYELKPTVYHSEASGNPLLKVNPLSFETVLILYF